MKRANQFTPDSRNIGGRAAIVEHMLRHQQALAQINSTYGHGRKRKGKHKKKKKGRTWKGGVDCDPPRTYALSQKLSHQRRVHDNLMMEEHEHRRAESLRRMAEYPTPFQRQQNPYDPVAHPAMLIRPTTPAGPNQQFAYESGSGGHKQLFVSDPYNTARLHTLGTPIKPKLRSPAERSARPSTAGARRSARGHTARKAHTSARPSSAAHRPASSRRPSRRRPKSASVRRTTAGMPPSLMSLGRTNPNTLLVDPDQLLHNSAPPAHSLSTADERKDPYIQLKKLLFDLVVEHRIFRERDLNALFAKALELNTHLDRSKVNAVIDALRAELSLSGGQQASAGSNSNPPASSAAASSSSVQPHSSSASAVHATAQPSHMTTLSALGGSATTPRSAGTSPAAATTKERQPSSARSANGTHNDAGDASDDGDGSDFSI